MRGIDEIGKLFATVGSFLVRRSSPRFSCGDCDRNAQCGLPPRDDCLYRLTQIARDGDRPSRPPDYLYPAVWPRASTRYEISGKTSVSARS